TRVDGSAALRSSATTALAGPILIAPTAPTTTAPNAHRRAFASRSLTVRLRAMVTVAYAPKRAMIGSAGITQRSQCSDGTLIATRTHGIHATNSRTSGVGRRSANQIPTTAASTPSHESPFGIASLR